MRTPALAAQGQLLEKRMRGSVCVLVGEREKKKEEEEEASCGFLLLSTSFIFSLLFLMEPSSPELRSTCKETKNTQ